VVIRQKFRWPERLGAGHVSQGAGVARSARSRAGRVRAGR
jgi:hypothetical protein